MGQILAGVRSELLGRSQCMIFNARNQDIRPISFGRTYKAVHICTAFIFVQKTENAVVLPSSQGCANLRSLFICPDPVSKSGVLPNDRTSFLICFALILSRSQGCATLHT